MRPSDSLVSFGLGSGFPLPSTYLRRVLVLCETSRSGHGALAPAWVRRARGRITGSPSFRICLQERQGPPRFLGPPLARCRGQTPRRVWLIPSPKSVTTTPAETRIRNRSARRIADFVADYPRPFARAPTHRRSPGLPDARRKARYRPAGLRSGRTGFAPAGELSEFHEAIATSFLSDQPFLVAPESQLIKRDCIEA